MLLVIDIGNTNIVFGIYDQDRLLHTWRISSQTDKSADEYGLMIRQLLNVHGLDYSNIENIVMASVVPKLTHTIPAMCSRYIGKEVMIVGAGTKTGINIKCDNPREVGADRIVNCIAAHEILNKTAIVVDMGTAISFDIISKDASYLGGAISPGIGIAAEALFMKTSKLPKVELNLPKKAIGKNTIGAMQTGIVYGYIGLIDGVIEKLLEEIKEDRKDVKIIATGGFSSLILKNSKYIEEVYPELTLYGLKLIYEKNRDER